MGSTFFAHHLWRAPALQCFDQPFVSGLSAAFKSFLECAFRLSANLKARSRLELSSITQQRSSELKSVMTLLARDSVALREDDDCACSSVSRSAGLARGTMPPPSRIAELRDLVFHEKLASCEKLRSCPAEQYPLYGLLEPSTMLSVPVFQPLPITTFPYWVHELLASSCPE